MAVCSELRAQAWGSRLPCTALSPLPVAPHTPCPFPLPGCPGWGEGSLPSDCQAQSRDAGQGHPSLHPGLGFL